MADSNRHREKRTQLPLYLSHSDRRALDDAARILFTTRTQLLRYGLKLVLKWLKTQKHPARWVLEKECGQE